MSDVKMPKWLRDAVVERADKELRWGQALPYDDEHDSDVTYGANICYAALIERTPEFNRARAAVRYSDPAFQEQLHTSGQYFAFLEGAHWQHGEDAAQVSALKTEHERAAQDSNRWTVFGGGTRTDNDSAQIAALTAEVESLKDPMQNEEWLILARDHARILAENERLREVMAFAASQCGIPDSRYAAHAAMTTLREALKEKKK